MVFMGERDHLCCLHGPKAIGLDDPGRGDLAACSAPDIHATDAHAPDALAP